MPVARGDKSRSPTDSLPEPMMPYPRCADEIGVLCQRSQSQLRLFKRNESATLANDLADTVKKERPTFHDTSTQDDHVRHKKIDQIGQAETKIVSFALNRSARQLISLLRKLADLFGGEICGIAVVCCYTRSEPCDHSRTSRKRFPTAPETASAKGTSRINNVMTDFGMGHIRAAVKLPIQDDPAADARADRHIDQSGLVSSSTPTGLPECRSIRVVFQSHGHVERTPQIFHRVVPAPSRGKVDIAKGAAGWIHHSGGSNSDARDLDAGMLCRFSQHADNSLNSI